MTADVVIQGAEVLDGDGPARRADVALRGDCIEAVAPELPVDGAGEVVDGRGCLLLPGFIDMHAHSALQPFVDPLLAPKVGQGFTTELIGPDGLAPAPVDPARRADRRAYLGALEGGGPDEWPWSTFSEYLDALDATRPVTTLVPSIGHGAVRDYVIGSDDRAPDADEVTRMRAATRMALEDGARTLSFGMIYLPGLYATTAELEAVAEEAAQFGVPLVPHVRNEADLLLRSIGEFLGIAQRTGSPLHLSHLKLIGNERLLEPLLEVLGVAEAAGVDITFDQYPYGAGNTVLTALLPPWALEGGATRVLRRLESASERRRIIGDIEAGLPRWENLYAACGPERIEITHAAHPRQGAIGQTLAELADHSGTVHPLEATLDLLRDTQLEAAMVDHYAREEVVREIFKHPFALVGSDGIFGDRPHPRLYGTAARVLGRYAMREGLISVHEATARLTSRAADRLGLRDRGRISEGLRADLVLVDPADFVDLATYENPMQAPAGVERVYVAGELVWHEGRPTGARPGGVLRTPLPVG